MIEVTDLSKSFGEKQALKGISFKVRHGEVFALLGPNGAGKTTTLKILAGQLKPSSGDARILDMDVVKESQAVRPEIGIVPEKTNLYERLSVIQNLELFCRLYDVGLENASELLARVGLLEERKTQVKKLSKGMKQRVLLARALLHKPRVLFLDEPTSGLDPASADNIHCLLKDLNSGGMTILLTSHNMEEVEKLCHRISFLDNGEIAAIGTPEELKLRYANRKMRVLLDGDPHREETLDIYGEESALQVAEWIKGGKIKAIHSCEPSLADIFVKVTGRELKC